MRWLKRMDNDVGYIIKRLREIRQKLSGVDLLPQVIHDIAELVTEADNVISCGRLYEMVKWMSVDEMKAVNGLTNNDVKLVGHILNTSIDMLEVEKKVLESLARDYFSSAEGRHENYLIKQNFRNICHVVDELGKLIMWLQAELLREAEHARVGENIVDKALSMANVLGKQNNYYKIDL